ncbi:hypothetical protein ACH4A8_16555 [Streptomyces vietnamensis]|uniref:hypothetical protein n=1 Tax=Streptomyces vietnamensis TaxID=362257 RepID=UPI0037B2761A
MDAGGEAPGGRGAGGHGEAVPGGGRSAGPSSSVEQSSQDVEAIHALGAGGVQARAIGPDGR